MIFAEEQNEEPSAEEKFLLDQADEAHRLNPNDGSPWNEVRERILPQLDAINLR